MSAPSRLALCLLAVCVVIVLAWIQVTLIPPRLVHADERLGQEIESRLIKEGASGSKLASFAFLKSQGTWNHYCVLDYSSTEPIVAEYAEQNGLLLGKIKLKSFYRDEHPTRWSVVLLAEGRYMQVAMPSECVTLQETIGRCAPIESPVLTISPVGNGPHCPGGLFALSP